MTYPNACEAEAANKTYVAGACPPLMPPEIAPGGSVYDEHEDQHERRDEPEDQHEDFDINEEDRD